MPNTINAITTGIGGLATTADNSGAISLQSAGSTVVAVTSGGVAVTGTLSATGNITQNGNAVLNAGSTVTVAQGGTGRTTNTAYAVICGGTTTGGAEQSIASVGTTGQVLTSNGAGALPTFQTISSGGMTLLGVVNAFSGNSVSLGSLTLTSYKALFIVEDNVAITANARTYISSTNVQSGGYFNNEGGASNAGTGWLDLFSGSFGGASDNTGNTYAAAGETNVTTSSTIIYFRNAASTNFTGSGTFRIYGVA